eukprot:EG_transcript_34297
MNTNGKGPVHTTAGPQRRNGLPPVHHKAKPPQNVDVGDNAGEVSDKSCFRPAERQTRQPPRPPTQLGWVTGGAGAGRRAPKERPFFSITRPRTLGTELRRREPEPPASAVCHLDQ